MTAVDEVYLEWLGAHERARLEADSIQQLQDRLTGLQTRAEVGGLARSALLPIEADLAAARLSQAYADSAVRFARLAVEDAINAPLAPSDIPDTRLLAYGAAEPASGQDNADVPDHRDQALAARAEAARATARLYDKRYVPQLKASASAGLSGQFTTVFPFYAALVGIEIPISDGGQGSARADAARADARALELRRSQHQTQKQRTQTRQQLRLAQARERVELAEAFIRAADAQLDSTLQRFEESAAGPGELTQARTQRGRAAAQLLTAKLDRARAALALDR